MLNLVDRLRAAIAAGNAPNGFISISALEGVEFWEEQGGHLLWLHAGDEYVYFVALQRTPISDFVDCEITEVMFEDEKYSLHPSTNNEISLRDFLNRH